VQIDWQDLVTAFSLYLVIEGVMPFLSPAALRRAMAAFQDMNDAQLRFAGLLSMLSGVALLWFVRS
jgi:uncharacterized protein